MSRLDKAMTDVDSFIKKHDDTILNIRHLVKSLFEITESIAIKEMNTDTKGYLQRETINRLSKRHTPNANELL